MVLVYTMKANHDGHNLSIETDTKTFMSLRDRGALSGFAFFLSGILSGGPRPSFDERGTS